MGGKANRRGPPVSGFKRRRVSGKGYRASEASWAGAVRSAGLRERVRARGRHDSGRGGGFRAERGKGGRAGWDWLLWAWSELEGRLALVFHLNGLIQIKYHPIQAKTSQTKMKQVEPNKLQIIPNINHTSILGP